MCSYMEDSFLSFVGTLFLNVLVSIHLNEIIVVGNQRGVNILFLRITCKKGLIWMLKISITIFYHESTFFVIASLVVNDILIFLSYFDLDNLKWQVIWDVVASCLKILIQSCFQHLRLCTVHVHLNSPC